MDWWIVGMQHGLVDCWYAAWTGGLLVCSMDWWIVGMQHGLVDSVLTNELESFVKEAVVAGIVNNELIRICKESVEA
jgi:hypothetical protein